MSINMEKTVNIEYFLDGKSLGETKIMEGSNPIDRIYASYKDLNILDYDGFILDKDRVDSRTVMRDYGNGEEPLCDFKALKKNFKRIY
jgi:hypothetical protein